MSEPKPQQLATQAVHAGQSPDPAPVRAPCPFTRPLPTSFRTPTTQPSLRAAGVRQHHTRIMNPTTDVFEKRVAALEGGLRRWRQHQARRRRPHYYYPRFGGDEDRLDHFALRGTYNLFHYTLPRLGMKASLPTPTISTEYALLITRQNSRHLYRDAGQSKLDIAEIEDSPPSHTNTSCRWSSTTRRHRRARSANRVGADDRRKLATKFLGATARPSARDCGRGQVRLGCFGRFKDFTEPDPSYQWTVLHGDVRTSLVHSQARIQGLRDTGRSAVAVQCILLLQGIETLHLRMERHSQNALAVD